MTGVSDTAALAAIGAAARELKLPTVRADAVRLAEIAVRERQTHLAYLAELLAAEIDDRTGRRRTRRIAEARFPRIKRLADFNPTPSPASRPPSSRWPPGRGSTPASLWSCSATPAPARPTCSSDSGWPPASKAAGSGTPPPPSWSTNSPKPPATGSYPASWAATAASTCCSSTSSATSSTTHTALSCCSRSSPNEKNAPPSPSGPTSRSANGEPCSPFPRLVAAIVDRVTFNAHILETGTRSYRLATSKTSSRKRAS